MTRTALATIAVTAAAGLFVAAPAVAHSGGTPEVTQTTLKIEELGPKYLLHAGPTPLPPEQASRIERFGPKGCWVGGTSVRCWAGRTSLFV